MRRAVLCVCAGAWLLSGCSKSNWTVVEKKSEMGDGLEITATVEAPRELKKFSGKIKHPFVRLQLAGGKVALDASPEEVIRYEHRGDVGWANVRVRFDEEDAFDVQIVQPSRAPGWLAVFPNPTARVLLAKMRKHEAMKIEWQTLDGKEVDSFSLKGVGAIIDNICEKAPSACTGDSPLAAEPAVSGSAPTVAPQTPQGLQLVVGKFPVASSQWKQARDLALAWCKSNADACDEMLVRELSHPRSGGQLEVAAEEAHLSSCNYESCPGVFPDVTLKKAGGTWSVTAVALRELGD